MLRWHAAVPDRPRGLSSSWAASDNGRLVGTVEDAGELGFPVKDPGGRWLASFRTLDHAMSFVHHWWRKDDASNGARAPR